MPADNLLYNCQANTRPLEFVFTMQPLEDAEQFVHVFHIEAGTGIAYIVDAFILAVFASDFDDSLLLPGRKLERVGKKVHPRLTDQRRVSGGQRKSMNMEVNPSCVF